MILMLTAMPVLSVVQVALAMNACHISKPIEQGEPNSRMTAAASVDDDGVELALSNRKRSSLMFFVVKSPATEDFS